MFDSSTSRNVKEYFRVNYSSHYNHEHCPQEKERMLEDTKVMAVCPQAQIPGPPLGGRQAAPCRGSRDYRHHSPLPIKCPDSKLELKVASLEQIKNVTMH